MISEFPGGLQHMVVVGTISGQSRSIKWGLNKSTYSSWNILAQISQSRLCYMETMARVVLVTRLLAAKSKISKKFNQRQNWTILDDFFSLDGSQCDGLEGLTFLTESATYSRGTGTLEGSDAFAAVHTSWIAESWKRRDKVNQVMRKELKKKGKGHNSVTRSNRLSPIAY